MEMGSPMAAMYLLKNPDHYTSHTFILFWWRNWVAEVRKAWEMEDRMDVDDELLDAEDYVEGPQDKFESKVVLKKSRGAIVASSALDDYKHRPSELEDMSLFEWIQCS
ncbi:hypothetical protein C8R44DRAFT_543662, partial [Mycena epipterygia]